MSSTETTTIAAVATIQPLSKELIEGSIDRQCSHLGGGYQRMQELGPLLYGIVQEETQWSMTFYVSYSTWDGRFLYVDEVTGEGNVAAGLSLLAGIAVDLQCSRLTWQYLEDRPMVDFTPSPTILHGWLTLLWPAHDITAFLSSSSDGTSSVIVAQHDATRTADESTLADDIRTAFASTLAATDDGDDQSTFRLRLATEQDLDAMDRLVHGLAVYEKEPDAVHVTKDHYRCDGFDTQQPLFFCVLLDSRRRDGKDDDGDDDDDDGDDTCSSYTCGMAFCYIARKKTGGLFLYLEDLFIEGDYRGGGAGMMVMKALAAVSLSLGCSKMVWQALDWNTPALNFYDKLGAKVVEGLITARFAGEALPSFASADSS